MWGGLTHSNRSLKIACCAAGLQLTNLDFDNRGVPSPSPVRRDPVTPLKMNGDLFKYSLSEQCGEAGLWFIGGPSGRRPTERQGTVEWCTWISVHPGGKKGEGKVRWHFLHLPRWSEIRRPLSSRGLIIPARFILAFLIKKKKKQAARVFNIHQCGDDGDRSISAATAAASSPLLIDS